MYKYALFHFMKDVRRDQKVPVGVVLWSEPEHWIAVRLPRENERVPNIPRHEGHEIVSAVEQRLLQWQEDGRLPYYPELDTASSDLWWRAVADLLHHTVQMGEFHPISLRHEPEQEVESLFASLVRPEPAAEPVVRIDGKITQVLRRRRLEQVYRTRQELPGAYGTRVRVTRAYRRGNRAAVVEGLNLAVAEPREEVDEFAGRVGRLRGNGMDTTMALGVLMGGDRGSEVARLKQYLEEKVCAEKRDRVFDLEREENELAEYAAQMVQRVERAAPRPQQPLPALRTGGMQE